jgi:hypothetical protein
MDPLRTVKKLTEWEPCSSRPVGKTKTEMDRPSGRGFKEDKSEKLVREVYRLWNEIVKQAKTHQGL